MARDTRSRVCSHPSRWSSGIIFTVVFAGTTRPRIAPNDLLLRKITDQTVRRHWQEATKVDIKGERVSIDPEGPLAQAQWVKTRYGMSTQTLPNGYCGLPLQRTCPHANACLTCPVFLTGPEFLPELREQRRRTLTLIDVSELGGQARMVEMNQQVVTNLNRMISEIEEAATEDTDTTHAG